MNASKLHNEEAEQAVLGAVMINGDALERIAGRITAADFYRQDHRTIFAAMQALAGEDRPVDVVTVSEWLDQRGELEVAGGLPYLAGIAKDTPSAANASAYADIVRDRSQARQALKMLGTAQAQVIDGVHMGDVLAELQGALESLSTCRTALTFREVLDQSLATIEAAADRRKRGIDGLTFGLPTVDRVTGGLHGPKLIILAGRPSLGKTAIANQVAMRAAQRGTGVGKLELEMAADEIGLRAMAYAYRQNVTALAHADPDAIAAVQRQAADHNIGPYPIFVDESSYRLPEIVSRITEWRRRHTIGVAIIDHLQIVATAGRNRNQELGEVTRALKRLAKRLNMPVIVLSQLSRDFEKHGRKPTLADLRDSGEIEQDADIVVALHGNVEQDEQGWRDVEIGLLKHRGGRVGWLTQSAFRFDGRIQHFEEVAHGLV